MICYENTASVSAFSVNLRMELMLMKYQYILLKFVTECGVHSPHSFSLSVVGIPLGN